MTDWRCWKPASGWTRSIMCCPAAAQCAPDACCSSSRCTPAGWLESIFLLPRPRRIRTRFPSARRRRFREARRWNAASRAWCAGTPWPWWSAPIKKKAASADTFRLSLPRPRFTRSRSITFSTPAPRAAIATSSTTRATRPREYTRGLFSKDACPKKNWKTSAAS